MNRIRQFVIVLLVTFSLLMSLYAAITERYVTTSGAAAYANSSDIAQPMSWATMLTNAAAGDRINVKAGTYTMTINTSDVFTNAGTSTSPIVIRGYSSTIGDGNQGRTGGSGAIITTNMPSLVYSGTGGLTCPTFTLFESINITSAKTSTSTLTMGANCVVKSCNVVNSAVGAGAIGVGANSTVFDNDLSLTSASATANVFGWTASGIAVINNRVKSNGTANGLNATGSGATGAVIGNVVYTIGSGGSGILIGNAAAVPIIYGNTVVGYPGDGINVITGSTVNHTIVSNMLTDNTGNGINMVSTANSSFLAYNRTRGNGTAIANGGDWVTVANYAPVTSATSDYTNAGSNDYTLLSTSPAKAASWFQFLDIGALQRQEPTAGGPTNIPSISSN